MDDKEDDGTANRKNVGQDDEQHKPSPVEQWDPAIFTPSTSNKANVKAEDREDQGKTEVPQSTYIATEWVDITSTETWSPEVTSSSVAAPAAPSSSDKPKDNVFNPDVNGGNIHIVDGHGSGDWTDSSSASSSSSAQQPAYTPPASSGGGGVDKLGLAWDWQNPRGKLSQWTGAAAIYSGSYFQ